METLRRFGNPRICRGVLALAMLVSGALVMYIGRGTTFSGDEMVWIATSQGFDLSTLLAEHGGHLQAVPRAVYRVMLEVFGLEYWPYRLLTVLASWTAVGLLYVWLTRRVPALVALAPCLVLLVFGSDSLHVIQGNGFTILVSIAAGLGALLALERKDRLGDLTAAALLAVGVLTYAVALPFVFAALLLLLLERDRGRLWVPGPAIVIYAAWWLWTGTSGEGGSNGITPSNVLVVPSWIFQAVGNSADALTGLSFDFGTGDSLTFALAPVLAVLVIAATALAFVRGPRRGLAIVAGVGFALWTMQALVAEPGEAGRLPNDGRYLLPGAVALLLILAEVARRVTWTPTLVAVVWLVAAAGIGTNLKVLNGQGAAYREQAIAFHDNVGAAAVAIANRPASEPTDELVETPAGAVLAMANLPWGEFGSSPEELETRPAGSRVRFDQILIGATGPTLEPGRGAVAGCRKVNAAGGKVSGELEAGVTTLRAPQSAQLLLGRFADQPAQSVGTLPAGRAVTLTLAPDAFDEPWQFAVASPWVRVCRTQPLPSGP